MKKLNKAVSLVCSAAMAMAMLAGCGNAESTGSAAGGGTFKFGAIGPLSGGAAAYGNAVCNAAELAVAEINEKGGINGYQVEYSKEDDELNAEKSVNAYNTLKDWGMQVLVGSTTSACSIAVSENTKADNMFQLTPSGSAVDCVKYDNVFRVCFSDPNQGIASAQYISDNNLATKVGIIYDSSDVYSSGIYQKFVEESAGKNYEVVSAEAFTQDNNTDFSVQLQKAKDAGADLVFLPIYYKDASLILTQANTMGYSPIFFGVDGLDGILTVENFDTSLAEGVMLLTPFAADAKDDLTVNFVTKYQEKYGETPNQFAADAYDAVYIIKQAIEAKNLTPDMSVSDLCEALKSAMTEIEAKGLTSEKMTWDASGEPNKQPKAVVIKNGAYVSAQ
ncbi:ABC transporter substrate-binding protein [Butyrivibrio sp. YAB3001]|uniref:ABC transporter substrate-binding protein n=1 Tax=Butyrivibrio sp. YAB3001 TaxID=1520812 RepID=UPI0008F66EAA|nr:ABC transporter substrate-binding protein [Butyrivibrio sp. YAB3001]SFB96540.1 branched-chain amino acid transport system substrate-binding protein [Butyrivibrio sp. YAB3001]